MTANNGQVRSREEYKKAKQEDAPTNQAQAKPAQQKRVRIRLIPIWLRLVLLLVSIVFCVMAGAAVGYGMLGGGEMGDILKESTWTHIIDLVDKK
ncbi:DNA-directed RNA polymerase subunit beta [Bacillus sp. USDA818B3_A]|uniref:DNA-directed RNA polymerase subunit beta n=1 Tax=Bacillus sp. USDA818B3_A TaxID=2698834 RepID=UPI00136E28E2|nr:DNA-directed RNA polymerase subunit beta [Bacillus sp. USDA818B3_A]